MLPVWSPKRKRSQMSSTKSEKRIRSVSALPEVYVISPCPQSPSKTEEPSSSDEDDICPESPLPEGYGYLPSAPGVDENGEYYPGFTKIVRYMRCWRCGINGDHWPPFCMDPVNDPPDADSHPLSWKRILRNFDVKKYLEEEQRCKAKEKPKPSWFAGKEEKRKGFTITSWRHKGGRPYS